MLKRCLKWRFAVQHAIIKMDGNSGNRVQEHGGSDKLLPVYITTFKRMFRWHFISGEMKKIQLVVCSFTAAILMNFHFGW